MMAVMKGENIMTRVEIKTEVVAVQKAANVLVDRAQLIGVDVEMVVAATMIMKARKIVMMYMKEKTVNVIWKVNFLRVVD